jgi:hypothetical protein
MTARGRDSAQDTAKCKRAEDADDSQSKGGNGAAPWFLLGMVVVGLVCLFIGLLHDGLDWKNLLPASACMVTGIGLIAFGVLELEWLERMLAFVFVGYIFWDAVNWFWTRRRALLIWGAIGVGLFAWGCLLSLRVVDI